MVGQVVEDVKQAHNAVGSIPTAALVALMIKDAKIEEQKEEARAGDKGPPKPALAGEWGRRNGLLEAVPLVHAKSFARDVLPLARLSNAVYEKNFVDAVMKELDGILGPGRAEVRYQARFSLL